MPSILLVRHAQASYGAADYDELSQLSTFQNRALHAYLPTRGINGGGVVIVSGPRRRHVETAERVCPDFPVEVDADWDEYSIGDVLAEYGSPDADRASLDAETELSSREFQNVLDDALVKWIADPSGTWPQFALRTRTALATLAAAVPSGGLGMAFTSAGPIASVAAGLLGADSTFVPLNRVQVNTGVTKLVIGRSGSSLVSFNDHTHLEIMNPSLITYR